MGARNCEELGLSLQKIISRLMENNELVNLLYYSDKNPLEQPHLTKEQKQKEVYEKLLKIVPYVGNNDNSQSKIVITIVRGIKNRQNNEFRDVSINVSVFVPLTTWIIKDTNLRPFAILSRIQESLDGKTINGLGKLSGGDFDLKLLTEEMSCYEQTYNLIEYA